MEGDKKGGFADGPRDTWRAELSVPFKGRKMIVRGPCRIMREIAEEDGGILLRAARSGGVDAVRKTQRELNAKK